jgi:copper chaperone CopZ
MSTLKFKTNITCSGCEAKVTPILNNTFGENNWNVDVNTSEKLLTVSTDKASSQNVIDTLKKVGFVAEEMA